MQRLACPKCHSIFDYKVDPNKGTHAEHECSCGQFLQWDCPGFKPSREGFQFGPPQPCQHAELQKDGALVPDIAT